MGYQVVDGFEVEQDYYNFERMNLPKDHLSAGYAGYLLYHRRNLASDPYLPPVQARAMDAHDFSKDH